MPRAKHGGCGCCDRNGQSADRLSANLRFFLNCASPFSSFFECNFDTRRVFCMRMVQYACFSKSELDKWLFFARECDPFRASGSVPTCFSLARARAVSGFLLFPFTSSPGSHNYLLCSGLSVKVFDLCYTVNEFCKWLRFSLLWVKERASQAFTLSFTPFSPGAFCSIAAPWRRSKTAKCGEGKNAKAFTLYALRMS